MIPPFGQLAFILVVSSAPAPMTRKTLVFGSLMLCLIILAALAPYIWDNLEKTMVAVHQRSTFKELQSWEEEWRVIKSDEDAFRAVDILEYVTTYYKPGPGYHADQSTEERLERQRAHTLQTIAQALAVFSDEEHGISVEKWKDWRERRKLEIQTSKKSLATNNDPLVNEELKKLQGEWIAEVSIINGQNEIGTRNEFETTATVKIKRDKFKILQVTQGKRKALGVQFEFSFTVDTRKNPKEMDLKDGKLNGEIGRHPFIGRTLPAIYNLKDDTLRIAVAISPDPKRPEKFTTEKESQDWQLVLKRAGANK